jgi:twitching motility protein PilT
MSIDMPGLLQMVMDRAASDLHLKAEQPPIIRVSGKLVKLNLPVLSADEVRLLIYSILTQDQIKNLEKTFELDRSFGIDGVGRFRVNVYKDRGNFCAALRVVAARIPDLDELGLPAILKHLIQKPRGLVLITGPTGHGKSTTLASLIDYINENRSEHILTIEDPIEYLHQNKRSIVSQRELGNDTLSFANALRAALREDPNVIMVGEMRDLETIHLTLTAAETGHLVFATLHTSSAAQTIDRLIDVFPATQQQQIRIMISNGLVAILGQTLLPRLQDHHGGNPLTKGRVLALEVLINTPAIANLIRESRTAQIYSAIQTGGALGMQTLESSLANFVKEGVVDVQEALAKSSRAEDLQRLIGSTYASAGSIEPGKGFGRF